jgi:hypothetical protein
VPLGDTWHGERAGASGALSSLHPLMVASSARCPSAGRQGVRYGYSGQLPDFERDSCG